MDDVKKMVAETNEVAETTTAAEPARRSTPDPHDFMHAAYHARKNPDHAPTTPMSGG